MDISTKEICKVFYQKALRWLLTKRHFILSIIFLWIFFEYLHKVYGVDFIVLISTALLGCGLEAVFSVVSFIIDISKKNKSDSSKKNKQSKKRSVNGNNKKGLQPILDDAFTLLTYQSGCVTLHRILSLILVFTLLLGAPAAMAHYQIFGRTVDFVNCLQYTDTTAEQQPHSSSLTTPSTEATAPLDADHLGITDKPSTNISETSSFLADPNRYFQLSDDDYDKVYFLSGPYAITDWSNPVEISQTLARYLIELQVQNRSNSFDTNAPSSLQNEVAFASELEICMTSSYDLDKIIDIRINAWNQYPKYSLAKLLASNQQQYALEYEKIGGSFETIEYYYAHSTFWLFESLSFSDVGEYTTKTILASIKMRYHDIASIAPANSHSKYYATILFEAFESLENSYV